MISALCWVKKGAALENPEKVDLSEEEFERIQKEMGVQLMDAKRELEEFNEDQQESSILEDDETEGKSDKNVPESAETANVQGDNQQQDLSIYDLDNYDQDSQDEMDESTMEEPSGMHLMNVKALTLSVQLPCFPKSKGWHIIKIPMRILILNSIKMKTKKKNWMSLE